MIEIKTSLSDDYPAVLRKIKERRNKYVNSNFAQKGYTYSNLESWLKYLLVIESFSSSAITYIELKELFANEKIEVYMFSDFSEQILTSTDEKNVPEIEKNGELYTIKNISQSQLDQIKQILLL